MISIGSDPDRASSGPLGRRRAIVALATGLLLLMVFDFAQDFIEYRIREDQFLWRRVWRYGVYYAIPWLLWAVFTPAVARVAERIRSLEGWGRRLAAHVLIGATIAIAHGALTALVRVTLLRGGPLATFAVQFWTVFPSFLPIELLVYGALVLAWHAIDYHDRYRERELEAARLATKAAEMEARAADARLAALRAQLDPHFLFNALNGLSGLVRSGATDAAVELLERLGHLLRLSLERRDGSRTTLRRELEFVRAYLDVERVRHGERLDVVAPEPGALAEALVPTLLLQPLVENAVRHGAGRSLGRVRVEVRARRDGEALILEVRDTGPGLPDGMREGVGLSNTRARLQTMFGDRASFEIRATGARGVVARVRLPLAFARRAGPVASLQAS